ncbi:MAG: stage II sporulation protein M [Planctomycetota bacterium]|jgi:uncharacterized membrane protein SpoIIM required for sporulation|nr:stage II sporulation protein M [Planctomycetota bacterium]
MARLSDFHRDRRSRWRRLEELIERADADRLDGDATDELYRLYRLSASDLSYLQTRTGDPALLDRLESLVAAAHARVTPSAGADRAARLFRLLAFGFPAAMRREFGMVALALAVFLGGGALGAVLSRTSPESAQTLLAAFPHILDQSPSQDAATRESAETTLGNHAGFSLFLFFHNTSVAVTCLALGLTFGVGTIIILFYNGLILGCTAMMYHSDGVLGFFLSWVGPHGALELPAIIIAAGAGFMLARAEIAGWGENRETARRDCLALVLGAALLLFIAGLIEGGFSQMHHPGLVTAKIIFACVMFLALVAWAFVTPVKSLEMRA